MRQRMAFNSACATSGAGQRRRPTDLPRRPIARPQAHPHLGQMNSSHVWVKMVASRWARVSAEWQAGSAPLLPAWPRRARAVHPLVGKGTLLMDQLLKLANVLVGEVVEVVAHATHLQVMVLHRMQSVPEVLGNHRSQKWHAACQRSRCCPHWRHLQRQTRTQPLRSSHFHCHSTLFETSHAPSSYNTPTVWRPS